MLEFYTDELLNSSTLALDVIIVLDCRNVFQSCQRYIKFLACVKPLSLSGQRVGRLDSNI